MTDSLLVAYASKHGSTREVAGEVAARLRERGLAVELRPAGEVAGLDGYDGVVLGGALYMGRLHPDARRFLKRHRTALAALPLAVFAMGPRSLEEKEVAGSRSQLDHALEAVPELEPVSLSIFGGVLDPEQLSFPFNRMQAVDARDWIAIHDWADMLAATLGSRVHALP